MAQCLKFWVKYQIAGLRNIGCSNRVVGCATRRVSQTLCILLQCSVFSYFVSCVLQSAQSRRRSKYFQICLSRLAAPAQIHCTFPWRCCFCLLLNNIWSCFFLWHIRGGSLNLNYVRIETSPCFRHWPNDPMSEWWLTLQKQHSGLITWWRLISKNSSHCFS